MSAEHDPQLYKGIDKLILAMKDRLLGEGMDDRCAPPRE